MVRINRLFATDAKGVPANTNGHPLPLRLMWGSILYVFTRFRSHPLTPKIRDRGIDKITCLANGWRLFVNTVIKRQRTTL